MKHKGALVINQPRSIVTDLFINSDYNKEYQDGFIKKELISGTKNQNGAKSKMYYKYGNRDMILIEIITKNNLPDSFEANYYHKHMENTMKCTFIEISDTQTRYVYEYEYTRINWFIPKLMAILFPKMYRKQGEKWMQQFKQFVEKQ